MPAVNEQWTRGAGGGIGMSDHQNSFQYVCLLAAVYATILHKFELRFVNTTIVSRCPGVRPGVCLGNWVETRAASSQLSLPAKFNATTTMRSDYSPAVSFLLLPIFLLFAFADAPHTTPEMSFYCLGAEPGTAL